MTTAGSSDEFPDDVSHQEEFEYLEHRAKMNFLKPRGILAINTKIVRLDTFELSKIEEVIGQNVYIRIHAGTQVKTTIVYDRVVVPARLVYDDLKHFNLQVRIDANVYFGDHMARLSGYNTCII